MIKFLQTLAILEAVLIVVLVVYHILLRSKFKKIVRILQEREIKIFEAGLKRIENKTKKKMDRMNLNDQVDYINSLLSE